MYRTNFLVEKNVFTMKKRLEVQKNKVYYPKNFVNT